MKKIEEVLGGQGGSHIRPFLWLHGESHEDILEEINRIEACGIREICLESRPHPDFCGPTWWNDLDFILKEAKKRGMRIWILDDDRFPTGHANGAYRRKHPELAKTYLAERHIEILGPVDEASVLISPFLGKDGRLLAVLACPKPDSESLEISYENAIDLTQEVDGSFVRFKLPKGRFRLFIIFTTQYGGGREEYINLIDTQSVRVLIEEVYEKHYEYFGNYFGSTFAGFFSDEPELGNVSGYGFHETLGKNDVKLPWSTELSEILREQWKEEFQFNFPALWYDMDNRTTKIRTQYMDAVTKLVYQCFSGQIGDWCEAHGAEYIGHIIEDDNAHARLGCSIGHFYREQRGQHMSGIDVVHYQIVPGFDDKIHQWIAGDSDGEFFHYGLAKMGSSCAHIDPKKKGRALCEIFGNYGWAEGVSFMKWLADHMLVRGINEFVPHAFSPKYPDSDCPPHFYARGNNPQFPFFTQLMQYMNRISHLISDGRHISDAVVLYHGEAEWVGKKTMLFQKPVRKLMEAQQDCDIVPCDVFAEPYVSIQDGKLRIHEETYGCLILPYCEALPRRAADFAIYAASQGLPVYMVDRLPKIDTNGEKLQEEFKAAVTLCPLNRLSQTLKNQLISEISCNKKSRHLRFYGYEHEDGKVYLFFNEHPYEAIDCHVTVNRGSYEAIEIYDAMKNKAEAYKIHNNTFPLSLGPGEMKIYTLSSSTQSGQPIEKVRKREEVVCDWIISKKEASSGEEFKEAFYRKAGEVLPNMNGKGYASEFSGTFRYEGKFILEDKRVGKCFLYLPKFGDCAQIFLNGIEAGMLLTSPGRLDISSLIRVGENTLVVEITNTLVWKLKDGASTHMQLTATGMNKSPILEFL